MKNSELDHSFAAWKLSIILVFTHVYFLLNCEAFIHLVDFLHGTYQKVLNSSTIFVFSLLTFKYTFSLIKKDIVKYERSVSVGKLEIIDLLQYRCTLNYRSSVFLDIVLRSSFYLATHYWGYLCLDLLKDTVVFSKYNLLGWTQILSWSHFVQLKTTLYIILINCSYCLSKSLRDYTSHRKNGSN